MPFRNLRPCLVFVTLLLGMAAPGSRAAEVTRDFPDAACVGRITFDDRKYDAKLVEATGELLFGQRGGEFPQIGRSFEQIDAPLFERQCAEAIGRLRRTRVLSSPAITDYLRILGEAIEDYCALTKVEMRAVHDPSALRSYARAETCSPFADALEGKSDIVALWRQQIQIQAKNNAAPDKYLKARQAYETRPDFLSLVRTDIMKYGWHNCANANTVMNSEKFQKQRQDAEEFFTKTFNMQYVDCEEQ